MSELDEFEVAILTRLSKRVGKPSFVWHAMAIPKRAVMEWWSLDMIFYEDIRIEKLRESGMIAAEVPDSEWAPAVWSITDAGLSALKSTKENRSTDRSPQS